MTTENEIEINYSEFRDDLTIQGGTPIQLEVRGEVYKHPIFKGTDNNGAIHTWVVLVQHLNGLQYESGHEYFEGGLDKEKLTERVKYIKANPFELMYPKFKETYDGLN